MIIVTDGEHIWFNFNIVPIICLKELITPYNILESLNLQYEGNIFTLEMSGNPNLMTQLHIPEDTNP